MAFTTLTRYLKLKIDSDLSADAVYNLQRIDALASTFVIDSTEKLKIQSKGNIELEPNDLALGGSGTEGSVEVGTSQHSNVSFRAYTTSFKVDSGLETKNQSANKTNYLKLAFESSTDSDPRQLKFDLGGTDRNISFDSSGTVVTKNGSGNVNIAGNMTATGGFIGNVTGNVSGTSGNVTATSNSTLVTLSSLSLPGSQVTGNISGNAANVTGTVAIVNGGTGATTAATAAQNLLPSYSSNANKILALNSTGTALEWKATGSGVVEEILVTPGTPITVLTDAPDSAAKPRLNIPKADTNTDGYLSSTDWDTFNSKEGAITLGTTGQYWSGNKSWQTLDKSAVGLGNVDNTADLDKPISTDTQDALDTKYNASNPSNFVDAAGAKSAAVTTDINGDQTKAPDCTAVKGYVTANSGPKFSTTWTVADGNSKTITHSLDTREVSITIYDENYETVYVDSETRTTVNAVDLVRVGTATGTWTVIVKKL